MGATSPNGPGLLRILGAHATGALSSYAKGRTISAIVRGDYASSRVLPLIPGFGSLRGTPEELLAFSAQNPALSLQVAPPLHLLMDQARSATRAVAVHGAIPGVLGAGVVVGIVDSGIDVKHPDFRLADGRTRVKWHLDLSQAPLGKHPELEEKYRIQDATGVFGAVMNSDDIDAAIAGAGTAPSDLLGHGTHVAGIAAASLGTAYAGMAPAADLVVVHATREDNTVDPEDLLRGAQFIMDRAEFMGKPAVVNLSLGTDFGPHDGTLDWEEALASLVGPSHPGHVIVAAAGNSGSIAEAPIHTSAHVTSGATYRVPLDGGDEEDGHVTIWVALRPNADLRVGFEGPSGEIIPPIREGSQFGRNVLVKDPDGSIRENYNAGVIFGEGRSENLVPTRSSGAIVALSGQFRAGRYNVVLEGSGDAELYVQVRGDPRIFPFSAPVREGTINLPATHPDIIGVGCTVNRSQWTSVAGIQATFDLPVLDPQGGRVVPETKRGQVGDVCWFSSAGPNLNGVPKPEIGAPGGFVIASMSRDAPPTSPRSVFRSLWCPTVETGAPQDRRCLQIDEGHGVLSGTSMSSPMVSGAVALLLEVDPTLTQAEVLMLLQAGAHHFRGAAPFEGQAGVGELDIQGSLIALRAYRSGARDGVPSRDASWVSLSAESARAGGSIPFSALFELRTEEGLPASLVPGDVIDADIFIDDESVDFGRPVRKGPGVFELVMRVPEGNGGKTLRVGASIAGRSIVAEKRVAIATDVWTAKYPSRAFGGCGVVTLPGGSRTTTASGVAGVLAGLIGARVVRSRRRRRSLHLGPVTS